MTGKQKFVLTISLIFLGAFLIQAALLIFHPETTRSETSLLNQYYHLKYKNPTAAKKILEYTLEKYPLNEIAQKESLLWQKNPSTTTALQTAIGSIVSSVVLKPVKKIQPVAAASSPPSKNHVVVAKKMTDRDGLLNQFYNLKKTNPTAAWQAINLLLKRYPHDVVALKEAGFYALGEHDNALSYYYFKRAYDITHDPLLALQCGYILSNMGNKRVAYQYFELATKTDDMTQRLKAEIALTNLRGVQTKFLPDPYFADLYFNPFYYSRFKLMVYPVILRVGRTLNELYQWQLYLGYRRTSDNKSGTSGVISQIYNDNVAITSLGMQVKPVPSIPLFAFVEAGKAVDLVYRDRSRWRNDFRMGFAYFTEWGMASRYTIHPTLEAHFKGDIYADAIYYSRYLDTIGTLRVRPGLEVLRYGASSLTVYFKGSLIQDRDRQFFNNLIEYGPGVVFVPSDRYNVAVRYESLSGHYLPASSPSPNPYSTNYHNGVLQLDVFFRF